MNPEFKRNCWLEISPMRLILMPMLIGLALMAAISLKHDSVAEITLALSLFGFSVLTICWGGVQAIRALSWEFSEGTWDSQRMSALTPWQMTWGKLFGSTLYPWYGGVILLFLAGFSALALRTSVFTLFLWGCGLICSALILHALVLMFILQAHRKSPDQKSRFGIGSLIFIFIFFNPIPFLFALFIRAFATDHGVQPFAWWDTGSLWWGYDWDTLSFTVATLVFMTFWALIGLWETMRRELMLPHRIWWWPLCLLFWLIWSAGFVQDQESWYPFFAMCAFSILSFGYFQLLTVRKDQSMWLRLIAARQNPKKQLAQHLEPGWLISFVVAIGLGLIAACLSAEVIPHLLTLFAICAFVLRDVAWILWLNLARKSRFPEGAALVSLFVAYGLLPLLFRNSDNFSFFLPPSPNATSIEAVVILVAALVQTALCVALFYNRWRPIFRSASDPHAYS